jgi:hypothetical protein
VIKMSGIADGLDVRVKEKKNQRWLLGFGLNPEGGAGLGCGKA